MIDGSISGASKLEPVLHQFDEYETGGNKLCSLTVEDNLQFKGKATYNNFVLSVTFEEYSPTIEFLGNQTRIVQIRDTNWIDGDLDSQFEYSWSASTGIRFDKGHVEAANFEFTNHVVEDSVAGTVYVTVTQTNSLGFKKDYSYSIGIPIVNQDSLVVNEFSMTSDSYTVDISDTTASANDTYTVGISLYNSPAFIIEATKQSVALETSTTITGGFNFQNQPGIINENNNQTYYVYAIGNAQVDPHEHRFVDRNEVYVNQFHKLYLKKTSMGFSTIFVNTNIVGTFEEDGTVQYHPSYGSICRLSVYDSNDDMIVYLDIKQTPGSSLSYTYDPFASMDVTDTVQGWKLTNKYETIFQNQGFDWYNEDSPIYKTIRKTKVFQYATNYTTSTAYSFILFYFHGNNRESYGMPQIKRPMSVADDLFTKRILGYIFKLYRNNITGYTNLITSPPFTGNENESMNTYRNLLQIQYNVTDFAGSQALYTQYNVEYDYNMS